MVSHDMNFLYVNLTTLVTFYPTNIFIAKALFLRGFFDFSFLPQNHVYFLLGTLMENLR